MSNVGFIPTELVLGIVENLGSFDHDALASLCLVSKRFHNILSLILYREIRIRLVGRNRTNLVPLICTLCTRPDLAARVKCLKFDRDALVIWKGQPGAGLSQRTILDYVWSLYSCLNMTKYEGNQYKDRFHLWVAKMREGDDRALSGLLLAVTPNLEDLRIRMFQESPELGPFFRPSRLPLPEIFPISIQSDWVQSPSECMAELACLSPMMKGIRHVRLLRTEGLNLSLLNLPFESLEHLELQIGKCRYNWGELSAGPRMHRLYPSLKSLYVNAHWDVVWGLSIRSCILAIIQNLECHGLKSFHLNLDGWDWFGVKSTVVPDFEALMRDLEPVKASLEHLQLDVNWYPNCWRTESRSAKRANRPAHHRYKSFQAAASFKTFTALSKLEIPQAALLPSSHYNLGSHVQYPVPLLQVENRLPQKLEELVIHSPVKNILLLLDRIDQSLSAFPSLRKIVLSCNWEWGAHANFFRRPLPAILALRSHGIEVQIIQAQRKGSCPLSEPEPISPGSDMWFSVLPENESITSSLGSDF